MANLRLIDSNTAPERGPAAPEDALLPDAEAFDAYSRTVSGSPSGSVRRSPT